MCQTDVVVVCVRSEDYNQIVQRGLRQWNVRVLPKDAAQPHTPAEHQGNTKNAVDRQIAKLCPLHASSTAAMLPASCREVRSCPRGIDRSPSADFVRRSQTYTIAGSASPKLDKVPCKPEIQRRYVILHAGGLRHPAPSNARLSI